MNDAVTYEVQIAVAKVGVLGSLGIWLFKSTWMLRFESNELEQELQARLMRVIEKELSK